MEITLKFLKDSIKYKEPFCPLVFGHYYHDYNSDKVCCRANTSASVAEVRETVAAGKWSSACVSCKNDEDTGKISYRQQQLAALLKRPQSVATLIDSVNLYKTRKQVLYYDFQLTLSNICNYACVMCGPGSSSIIAKKLNSFPVIRQKLLPPDLIFPEYCRVSFSGGEPFLDPVFLAVLKKLPRSATVIVTTNGSICNEALVSELSRFKDVHLAVSIDGIAGTYEKIRLGGSWSVVEHNVKTFATRLNTPILINTVVQKLNISELPKIAQWVTTVPNAIWQPMTILYSPSNEVDETLIEFTSADFPAGLSVQASAFIRSLLRQKSQVNRLQNQRD